MSEAAKLMSQSHITLVLFC